MMDNLQVFGCEFYPVGKSFWRKVLKKVKLSYSLKIKKELFLLGQSNFTCKLHVQEFQQIALINLSTPQANALLKMQPTGYSMKKITYFFILMILIIPFLDPGIV